MGRSGATRSPRCEVHRGSVSRDGADRVRTTAEVPIERGRSRASRQWQNPHGRTVGTNVDVCGGRSGVLHRRRGGGTVNVGRLCTVRRLGRGEREGVVTEEVPTDTRRQTPR